MKIAILIMNVIDVWNIQNLISNKEMMGIIDNNASKSTKLLDLSKESYSTFEKFVYDTAVYHFKRLNIDINCINSGKYYIEFWCKNKFDTHKLHVDCDEYEKKTKLNYIYPLLSCVTYFNDNKCPTIITNVDMDTYKYKEFDSQTEIFLSMPKCNKQITFDGRFFHGSIILDKNFKEDSRYIIAINLWDKKPSNIDYYASENDNNQLSKIPEFFKIEKEKDFTNTINFCKKIINYNLFEDILYNYNETALSAFKEYIQLDNSEKSCYKFILDSTIERKEIELKLKNKYGDIIDDINEIMNENANLKYNRFLQRFHYEKVYNTDICRYIINESEKYATNNGGWTKKRHNNYPTTDLPVERIPSIFGLILETLHNIVKKVKKSYGLKDNMVVNIHDLFVVKYKDNEQNYLDMHRDGSFLSFNILLSDAADFEGGGTYFDDGLTAYLEQGDILIHSSKIKHAGLPITKGTRYLLVGFLNLDLSVEDILNNT
jgi:hypothetical protein